MQRSAKNLTPHTIKISHIVQGLRAKAACIESYDFHSNEHLPFSFPLSFQSWLKSSFQVFLCKVLRFSDLEMLESSLSSLTLRPSDWKSFSIRKHNGNGFYIWKVFLQGRNFHFVSFDPRVSKNRKHIYRDTTTISVIVRLLSLGK